MSLAKYSGLVALGLALLYCNSCCSPPGPESPVAVQFLDLLPVNFDGVYKIDDLRGSGSAIAVKINKLDDSSFEVTLLSAKHVLNLSDVITKYLVVNKHISNIITDDEDYRVPITFVDAHPFLDICVIKALLPQPIPISNISAAPASAGQEIYSIGYPAGFGPVITDGYICLFDPLRNQYIHSAAGFYGNSGGAIIDKKSMKVIGLTCSIFGDNSGALITHMGVCLLFSSCDEWLKQRGLI